MIKTYTYAFDFDGVIHRYRDGWNGGSIYDKPNMDIVGVIRKLLDNRQAVVIITTRRVTNVIDWIDKHGLFPVTSVPSDVLIYNTQDIVGVTNRKLPAIVYVDDRSYLYNFRGESQSLFYDLYPPKKRLGGTVWPPIEDTKKRQNFLIIR